MGLTAENCPPAVFAGRRRGVEGDGGEVVGGLGVALLVDEGCEEGVVLVRPFMRVRWGIGGFVVRRKKACEARESAKCSNNRGGGSARTFSKKSSGP